MTFKDLRLKEVINCCDGAKLGAVVDLKFCPETGKIEELLVAGTGKCFQLFFSKVISIPYCDISRIGPDAIIVKLPPPPPPPLPGCKKPRC
ncbi:MAG: YlmC/YmxH family sporulation protein [Lachnospiraceae bacterium]|nr:YlmC/YmxH family sporulation protein [Lachnospiraceae bacterium]